MNVSAIAAAMLRIGEKYGWTSIEARVAAAHYESFIPGFVPSSKVPHLSLLRDHSAQRHAEAKAPFFKEAVFLHVAGNGNCQDNSTLQNLFGNYERAFELRVRKGLHTVQNWWVYSDLVSALSRLDSEVPDFMEIFFRDRDWECIAHDVGLPFLIGRPVVVFNYTGVRKTKRKQKREKGE